MTDIRPTRKLTQTFCHSTTEKLSGNFIPTSLAQEKMSPGSASVRSDPYQDKKPEVNSKANSDDDTLIIVD